MKKVDFSKMPQQAEFLSVTDIVSETAQYLSIYEYLNTSGIP
jgi:hypothetical protein